MKLLTFDLPLLSLTLFGLRRLISLSAVEAEGVKGRGGVVPGECCLGDCFAHLGACGCFLRAFAIGERSQRFLRWSQLLGTSRFLGGLLASGQ